MKYLLLTVLVIGAALFTRCTHSYKKPPAEFIKEQFGFDLPPHTTLLGDVRTYNDFDLVGYSRIKYRLGEAIDADAFLKTNGFKKTEADHIGENVEFYPEGHFVLERDSITGEERNILGVTNKENLGIDLHASYFRIIQLRPLTKVVFYNPENRVLLFFHAKHIP